MRAWQQVAHSFSCLFFAIAVRTSGMSLLRTLINLSVRLCDPHHSSPEAVASALQLLIPFLLKKGLVAETKEARAATLGMRFGTISNNAHP